MSSRTRTIASVIAGLAPNATAEVWEGLAEMRRNRPHRNRLRALTRALKRGRLAQVQSKATALARFDLTDASISLLSKADAFIKQCRAEGRTIGDNRDAMRKREYSKSALVAPAYSGPRRFHSAKQTFRRV